jgi:hypothetical protein
LCYHGPIKNNQGEILFNYVPNHPEKYRYNTLVKATLITEFYFGFRGSISYKEALLKNGAFLLTHPPG